MIVTSWRGPSEVIRYATLADLPQFVTLLADPQVGQWLWFTPAPPEMFESFFKPLIEAQDAKLAEDTVPHTAVFTVESHEGEFLGQGAVVAVDASPGGFEIGFQMRKATWGQGIGTRLAEFLCAYAIHQCAAFRIEASCLEGNTGSRALLTKIGLELEGTRPDYRLKEKIRHTELLFGATVSRLDTARFQAIAQELGLA